MSATPGWFGDEAFRKLAGIEQRAWDNLGALIGNLLAPPAEPGPPYVHTLVPPEPIGQDEDGNDIYPPPGPAYTLTHRPVADVVAEAGFGPVPERIEVTADFCQCPACRGSQVRAMTPQDGPPLSVAGLLAPPVPPVTMPFPVVRDMQQLWHDGRLYWLRIDVHAEPAETPEPGSGAWFPMRADLGRRIADMIRADAGG